MIDIFTKLNKKTNTRRYKSIPKSSLIASDEYEGFPDPMCGLILSLWKLATQEVTKALIELNLSIKTNLKKMGAII